MADAFANYSSSMDGPATVGTAIDVSSVDADLSAQPSRAIYVGVTGDVKVDMLGGGTGIIFKAAPVGILPIRAMKVYHTGSTATNMVALS